LGPAHNLAVGDTPGGYWNIGHSASPDPTTGAGMGIPGPPPLYHPDYNRRVYPGGTLPFYGYLTDVNLAYCPDQTVSTSANVQMDGSDAGRDRWNAIVAQDPIQNNTDLVIGYSSFMYRYGQSGNSNSTYSPVSGGPGRYGPEHPYSGENDRRVTLDFIAANYAERGYRPILWACAVAQNGKEQAHQMRGVNAAMFDGSSRWVSVEELMALGEQSAGGGGRILDQGETQGSLNAGGALGNGGRRKWKAMQILTGYSEMTLTPR
jgi:hypothetical protein